MRGGVEKDVGRVKSRGEPTGGAELHGGALVKHVYIKQRYTEQLHKTKIHGTKDTRNIYDCSCDVTIPSQISR